MKGARAVPRLSVLMPVYNCEDYVAEAVTSILLQSFRDFELIVINDGSTDATARIVELAAESDSRVRLVSRENRGITASLNEALGLAQGELIARMDGDDVAVPKRFALQTQFLDANPDCGVVGGQMLFTDPEGRALTTMHFPLEHTAIVETFFNGASSIGHPTVVFRRGLAEEVGGYSDKFIHAEDVDFFLRMAERMQIVNLPDILIRYRQHLKSIGRTHAKVQAESHYRAICVAATRTGRAMPKAFATADFGSLSEDHLRWGWWALNEGEVSTARHYARKVLWNRPMHLESWRLLAAAMRGW